MQLAGWEESCRSQVAAALSKALAGVSAQLSEGQVTGPCLLSCGVYHV